MGKNKLLFPWRTVGKSETVANEVSNFRPKFRDFSKMKAWLYKKLKGIWILWKTNTYAIGKYLNFYFRFVSNKTYSRQILTIRSVVYFLNLLLGSSTYYWFFIQVNKIKRLYFCLTCCVNWVPNQQIRSTSLENNK